MEGEHAGLLHNTRRLEPRDHQGCLPVVRHDEHGEPLQGHRVVAGEVRQIEPERQEKDIDTEA